MAKNNEHEQTTRQQLLEAAGQVFAEKGYDRATGKEICDKAGANTAAINYYFQGMEGLYQAAVIEAHQHLVSLDTLQTQVAVQPDGCTKLEAFIKLFVRNITSKNPAMWMLKVIGREVLQPTPFMAPVRDMHIIPKLKVIKGVVAEIMGLPSDHPAVGRGFISMMAPCTTLLLFDRELLKILFPNLGLGPEDAETLAKHLIHYAMAGLTTIAAEIKKSQPPAS